MQLELNVRPLAPRSILLEIPEGEAGIREILKLMRVFALQGSQDDVVRGLALELVGDYPGKRFDLEVLRLFRFCRDEIRYVHDPFAFEMLHVARRVLEDGQADCDGKVVLLCALLGSIGHLTRIRAVGFEGRPLSHVFCFVLLSGQWVALDPTADRPAGWQPSRVSSAMEIECS